MSNSFEKLDILAIGLDSFTLESIKKALKANHVQYHLTIIKSLAEMSEVKRKSPQAIFLFTNLQRDKMIDEIRFVSSRFSRSALTVLSPNSDAQAMAACFRAGVFDYMTVPLEQNDLRTVIYRLKLFGVVQGGQWTPERAVLHLFSRPENFSSPLDVATNLNHYLNLFFDVEKELTFSRSERIISSLGKKLKFSPQQVKRLKRFLADETGFIFGLRFTRDKFYFLVKSGEGEISYLVATNKSTYPVKSILSPYLANVLRTSIGILSDARAREEIRILSVTDEITGLFNQRKLLEDLDHFISRYEVDRTGFSLLFVDIDYFKNVNDQFGHVIGSQLLIDMAKVVKAQLRSSDLVYRYGGDEFIVLLPKSKVEESKRIALRISDAVKAAEFEIAPDKTYQLSLSVGIADFPNDAKTAKEIIEFADKMMYLSKKSGRGKVFHITEVVA